MPQNLRMTQLPVFLFHASEEQVKICIRQLAWLSIKPQQVQLIQAVLSDEKKVSIKDLFACYATQTSLMQKLDRLSSPNTKCSDDFDQLVNSTVLVQTRVDEQLRDALTNGVCQRLPDEAKQRECLRHVHVLAASFSHLESLKTAEVIKAMFVLPLELKRQQNEIKVQTQSIDVERFFWTYHLKDSRQPEFLLQPKS